MLLVFVPLMVPCRVYCMGAGFTKKAWRRTSRKTLHDIRHKVSPLIALDEHVKGNVGPFEFITEPVPAFQHSAPKVNVRCWSCSVSPLVA